MRWLVTGAAGFIGAHVCQALGSRGDVVAGLDNLIPYYDPALKLARLQQIASPNFRFIPADIADSEAIAAAFDEVQPDGVIHLAAQAGVRHALTNPTSYARSNLMGFVHVLEGCRNHDVEHLVYASSSSVYGETSRTPFSVHDPADHPVSLYAATKRSNEILAHSYSHVYGVPTTGLRFFTVYGPWGRPDMAYYAFAQAIRDGQPVRLFGDGSALRDFTYIDDIVEGILRVADLTAVPNPGWSPTFPDPATSTAPYRLYNIGRGQQHRVDEMIGLLEQLLGRRAIIEREEPKLGDVPQTHAEVDDLEEAVGFRPKVELSEGLARFVDWLRSYERS